MGGPSGLILDDQMLEELYPTVERLVRYWDSQKKSTKRKPPSRQAQLKSFDGVSLQEAADAIGVSRERARQIQVEALKKLAAKYPHMKDLI